MPLLVTRNNEKINKVALEITEVLKSNKLSFSEINEVLERVSDIAMNNCRLETDLETVILKR